MPLDILLARFVTASVVGFTSSTATITYSPPLQSDPKCIISIERGGQIGETSREMSYFDMLADVFGHEEMHIDTPKSFSKLPIVRNFAKFPQLRESV